MKIAKQLGLALVITAALAGCQKELSFEGGGTPSGGGSGVTIGNDCIVEKIATSDTLLNAGTYAITAVFNSSHQATSLFYYDSVANQLDDQYSLTYSGDTVRVDPTQYFLLDASKKVKTFRALLDPTDPASPVVTISYTYGGNLLSSKKIDIMAGPFPLTLAQINYTYSGNNLVGMTAVAPLTNQTQQDATVEYYSDKRPKNFLYLFPDGTESGFNLGLSLGTRPENAPKRIVIRNYDLATGMVQDSSVANFSQYEFSRDGYALSYYLAGDDLTDMGLFVGRNKLTYHCR